MDEIKTPKYILSLFSLNSIIPLLYNPGSISPTLLLPDCSTFSLQHLVNIITTGYTVTEGMSTEEMNEITEAAKVLSVHMKDLQHSRNGVKEQQQHDDKQEKKSNENGTSVPTQQPTHVDSEPQKESMFAIMDLSLIHI